MKILIVEDQPVFRDTLLKIVEDWYPDSTAECAANGTDALRLVQSRSFTHLLLDLQISDIDGFVVADAAIKRLPDIRIVALTSHCDDYTVYRVLKRRILSFVNKREAIRYNFHQAIANAEVDLIYHSPSFQRLKAERSLNSESFDKILSDREVEILSFIAIPFEDYEIATELKLSIGTVEKHRFNILRKLGLASTTALVRFARQRGIVRIPPVVENEEMMGEKTPIPFPVIRSNDGAGMLRPIVFSRTNVG